MRKLTLVIALLILLAVTQEAVAQKNKKKNSFIIILADDLGYGELGCYGQRIIKTPNLDRMASSGIMFTSFYSGSPVSAPSRCSLLTGLNSGHAQIRDNVEIGKWDEYLGQMPLEQGSFTLGKMMQEAGYSTACIGKWGLGGPGSTGVPWEQGFSRFFGYLCQRQAHNHYPSYLWFNDRQFITGNPDFSPHQKLQGDPLDANNYSRYSGSSYAEDLFTEEALNFITGHRDSSFFLMVSYTLPHLALQVPERYLNEYGNLMNDKPYTGQAGYLPCRWPHATYAAMVSALDDAIGRILKTLKENGIDSSTCVMFTSDNGATFNIGGADPGFFRSNGDLRGGKGSLYEGGIRVPLIIRWPGHTGNGIATDIPLAFWDIMPTMAELSGARQKTGTDGISFASLLAGKELKKEHEFLYWEFPGSGGSFAVRSGNWKLIRKDITRDQSSKIELYDLKADPGEKFNVASAHPDILNRLKQYSRKRSPAGKAEWNFIL